MYFSCEIHLRKLHLRGTRNMINSPMEIICNAVYLSTSNEHYLHRPYRW